MTAGKLQQIFLEIIKGIEPLIRLPQKSLEKVISIKEKIEQIRQQIFSGLSRFSELVKDSKNKTETIVTFLGLLELVKQRLITVDQKEKFQEITFQKYEES